MVRTKEVDKVMDQDKLMEALASALAPQLQKELGLKHTQERILN